ncbi:peptidylprolyl isomerase [Polyangium aurulentum]|uniref:peptidylprolyl isomerase n=1 Tax=Polyangium aurulentum TaxID=2567896 RepID=UPI0010AEC71C|nr:peptidylprolyl isomerase [Polyangium aurulentum]UQA56251.1 peptidyl-prolyl cis-trans isomerase [Polyangium aurulentum]
MRPSPSPFPRLRWLSLLAATVLASSGCCNLGADDHSSSAQAPGSASPPVASARPSEAPSAEPAPTDPAPAATAERQIAGAAHILFAYKGAERAPKTITRSKADAKKRADEAHAKLKDGKATFEELVTQYSDDDISKQANGMIGNFERNAMPAAFADATFNLKVGDVSEVVETPQGFHIIKRTR